MGGCGSDSGFSGNSGFRGVVKMGLLGASCEGCVFGLHLTDLSGKVVGGQVRADVC